MRLAALYPTTSFILRRSLDSRSSARLPLTLALSPQERGEGTGCVRCSEREHEGSMATESDPSHSTSPFTLDAVTRGLTPFCGAGISISVHNVRRRRMTRVAECALMRLPRVTRACKSAAHALSLDPRPPSDRPCGQAARPAERQCMGPGSRASRASQPVSTRARRSHRAPEPGSHFYLLPSKAGPCGAFRAARSHGMTRESVVR
jgi:hypothetical protein